MRVVVADDTLLTREGIVHVLRDAGVDVVGQAEDADALLRQVRLLDPDVVVVDIKMPPTHTDEGLVAAQRIRQEHSRVGILVLSQYVETRYAVELLRDDPGRADECGGHARRRSRITLARRRLRAMGAR